MKAIRQPKLFKLSKDDAFGGSALKGNPKKQRYIPRTLPMHITLKSDLATGARSLLLFHKDIRLCIERQARFIGGVKLFDFVNVGNHIHIMARFHNRTAYHRFIRAITGRIARIVLKRERGAGSEGRLKFWSYRPFSRIVHAGRRSYENLVTYMAKNRAQLFGVKRVAGASQDPHTLSFIEIVRHWDAEFTERLLV